MHLSPHQAGMLQHFHMLGRGRKRHAERGGEIAHIALSAGQAAQHRAPRGVGEGVEDGVEGRVLFNHVVECSRAVLEIQPCG
jgi:hypothetical protein